jgi:hypothetical protein
MWNRKTVTFNGVNAVRLLVKRNEIYFRKVTGTYKTDVIKLMENLSRVICRGVFSKSDLLRN